MTTVEDDVDRDYTFTPEEIEYRAAIRAFLAEHLPESWVSLFSRPDAVEVSNKVTKELADAGYLIQHWPSEYGGKDGSIWMQAVAQEELWAHGEPRGGQYMNVNWIGPAIMHFGTEEQKRRYLPPIMRGEVLWAQLFSEPDAGSDLASLSTSAAVQPDGSFIVNGAKTWTSYGHLAETGFLLCRTEPGSRRSKGLSVLIIDMNTPGIERREIKTSLGTNRIAEEFFTDVHVPADALLGELNNGWAVAMTALGFERSGSARYARSTRVLGWLERLPESAAPELRTELAELLAEGRAAELANYNVVSVKEEGRTPTWQSSEARIFNSLYEQRVADFGETLLGPYVRVKADSAPSRAVAEVASLTTSQASSATVTAGTYEIQLGIIAQRRLGLELAR
ncbi:MAG: Acyl-CoA dehydrogenase [Subtercola sp.]|nr:Acyl-CoA dehydrogenase [Subtercola sp.]